MQKPRKIHRAKNPKIHKTPQNSHKPKRPKIERPQFPYKKKIPNIIKIPKFLVPNQYPIKLYKDPIDKRNGTPNTLDIA